MNTYNLSTADMQKEKDTIQQILVNNNYDPSILEEIKNKKHHQKHDIERTKWAKFTYTGRETKFITKIFKNSNIRIALSANNTIEKLLTTKQEHVKSKYDKSGAYELKRPTCNMTYIGQTGCSFKTRFQEHLRDFKYNKQKSKFAQHLLDKQHSMDKMENTMDIIHITSKGKKMDTIEKYYIYI